MIFTRPTATPDRNAASSLDPTAKALRPSREKCRIRLPTSSAITNIQNGSGIPRTIVVSISDRLKPMEIGRWPVWISEIDCSTLSSPRVTMNGCTPVLTTRMPTRQPIAIGSRSITRTATTVLLPPEIICAPMTLESVAAAPTDRSSWPGDHDQRHPDRDQAEHRDARQQHLDVVEREVEVRVGGGVEAQADDGHQQRDVGAQVLRVAQALAQPAGGLARAGALAGRGRSPLDRAHAAFIPSGGVPYSSVTGAPR